MSHSPAISIVEVSPRDGLQNEAGFVETIDKLELIYRLIGTGAKRIEVASFVNPRRVPQMADAEAVVAGLPDAPGVSFIGLCLNERGVQRAIASRDGGGRGLDEAGCVLVATDGFGIANQGQTVEDGIRANTAMLAMAKAAGLKAQLTISASFGCPYEGHVPQDRIVELAARMADAGAEEIALADTIGVAVPRQVGDLVGAVFAKIGKDFPLRIHLHDTRGLAPANAWAAYEAGCRVFDSALGGLGGCPFAPGAAGNVGTEELVYLFERSGVDCGIDLDRALAANSWFAGIMGRPLPSRVGKAGDFSVKGARAA